MAFEMVKLGDFVKITSGFAFKSELFNDKNKGLPLIRIRDVVRGYSDTFYNGDYKDEFIINNDDALIGMDGEFNISKWRGGKSLLNQRVCKIESNSDKLNQEYLVRFLPLALKRIEDITPFVTVKHLSVKNINEIQIPLPPLLTQIHIAKILDKADELRQNRKIAITKLDELLQATFVKMFGDPVVNDKGWEEKPFNEIVINFNKKDDYSDNDKIWLLNLDMIEQNTGIILEKQFIFYKDLNSSTKYFDGTTVLYNKLRPYLNKVVMPKDDEHGYCTSELMVLKPKGEFINRYFLTYYLRSNEFVNWASQKVAGAKMPRLTMVDFWEKLVYIPPKELQTQFAQIAQTIESQKSKFQAQLAELDTLFLSLQQRAFGGELVA